MNRRNFFSRLLAAACATPAATEPANSPPPAPAVPIPPISIAPPSMDDLPPWLEAWRQRPHYPLWESEDNTQALLIQAAARSQPIEIIYHRGSTPGKIRHFTPALIFRTVQQDNAPLYVTGWCHERRAHRTFRLDHLIAPQAYHPPAIKAS